MILRTLPLILLLALSLPACAQGEPPAMKPYTESIQGTLVRIEMVPIPGGKLIVPDPDSPTKEREISIKPFYMAKFELLWDVFDIWAYRLDQTEEERIQGVDAVTRPSKPYGAPDRGFGHQGYPAISMSHFAADMFCRWLSRKTGKKYRLPSEHEWMYAAIAGAPPSRKPFEPSELKKIAWYWENSDDKTHLAGKKEPNKWGLYDMFGNAGEWCTDEEGVGILKGGSYLSDAEQLNIVYGQRFEKSWQSTDPQNPKSKWWYSDGPFCGFRIICEP
ncbi:MAG: SUMF1/EgtB/PvdO family nonheme iron enzyme [Armatimonadetes bacterium]|nr:SUMF1/EgtB/PvdO family nonheme iron enzyme [Armatimonadota bacterium]